MENFINNMKKIITLDMIIYGLIILAVILLITVVIRSLKVKKVQKELEVLEFKYTELKGIPLSFKLNKATALSKVNKSISGKISEYQTKFDEVQEQLKEYSVILAEVDDFAFSKKIKKANEKIELLLPVSEKCDSLIKTVDALFDEVLEQENMQRDNINTLKNEFRNAKKKLLENRGVYRQSVEYLDEFIIQIENMFSIFEEWMFASEFNKASDKQNEVKNALNILNVNLNVLPGYYERACIVIPNKEEAIAAQYTIEMQNGVYLNHLEVKKNLEIITDRVSDVLVKLSVCNLENLDSTLDDCDTRLQQLEEQIAKESESFEVVSTKVLQLFERIKELNVCIQNIKDVYNKVHARFGFENLSGRLSELDNRLDGLNEMRFKLDNVLTQKSVPYSTLLISYDEVVKETTTIECDARDIKGKLDNATSDEERAKKQLIKLQLIVNEMKTKITKHRLPSIDEKFEDDIRNANVYIVDVIELLESVPLDVEELNKKLQEGIDYIYTLYNSVNNLVGMAIMVENAILFGNKYRSEYPEIDSELTRAELCFTNGQYTKSLKIAISTIEKLHPGAYEKLISSEEVGANASA